MTDYKVGRWFDESGVMFYRLRTKEIAEYCKLSEQYGRLLNISRKENPFYISSKKAYAKTISYLCANHFQTKWNYSENMPFLSIAVFEEVCNYESLIVELTNFFVYFRDEIPTIKSEIRKAKNKIKRERKLAA